jgi:uncharacterized surface protein with fasciclin (FAS1) repeats
MKDIIQTATEQGNLTVLLSTIQKLDLEDILRLEGPFTMFAPTDEAFLKVSKKTSNDYFKDRERLTEVLTYHMLSGLIKLKDVSKNQYYSTIQGQKLLFDARGCVNNANLLHTDIQCKNGIIHIIDKVLIPK